MNSEAKGSDEQRTNGARMIMTLWPLMLVLVYCVIGFRAVSEVQDQCIKSREFKKYRMHPTRAAPGKTQPDMLPTSASPQTVTVGVYVERIVDVSTRNNLWVVDFYIWFRWYDKGSHPGKDFQVIDGEIVKRDLVKGPPEENSQPVDGKSVQREQQITPTNGRKYALYRVQARITKFFNLSRFPWDDHLLVIRIEDSKHQHDEVQYVADEAHSSLSSRVEIPGYEIDRTKEVFPRAKNVVVKPHSYKTTRGDPTLQEGSKATHSQFIYGIWIYRAGWGFYFKMFQGLFAAVAIALLTFFVKPTYTPRFSFGVGAFFAAVASGYITAQQLPNTEIVTLRDIIIGVGMVTIFLTLMHSEISLYLYDRKKLEERSSRLDKVAFAVFFVAYVVINFALAQAARFCG